MKKYAIFFFFSLSLFGSEPEKGYFNKVVSAVWKIEGGSKTRFPYGIKSVKTFGNKNYARKIAFNTVKANWQRWLVERQKRDISYLQFLANRYCPKSCDSQGNINWFNNITKLVEDYQ
jgi:hypothetical protein